MYEVSTEIRERILDQMVDELENRYYGYTEYALNAIIDRWFEQKKELIEVLSKHPNWCPEDLMIKFDKDFDRDIDLNAARKFIGWLYNNTNMSSVFYKKDNMWFVTRSMYDSMHYLLTRQTFIPENDPWYTTEIEYLNKMHADFRFRPGQKSTKIMRKICKVFGWDKIMAKEYDHEGNIREYNAFEREYAKYCDAMCPIKVSRHTCISVNPIDFLLMSNGNSWDSCHYIGESDDKGCYSSGTISYMLDKHSMIFYTVDGKYDGDEIARQPKINRQVFGYTDNQLLQSRLYPQNCDSCHEEIYKDIREIVQKVIADCEDKPNLWIKKKVSNVDKGQYATVYEDWYHFSNLCSVSVFSDCASRVDLAKMVLGAQPMCIECGYNHRTEDNISCCNDDRYACVHCGRRMWEDDVCWVGDDPYCSDCTRYCHDCCEYYPREDVTYLNFEGRYVCNDCLDSDNYVYCEDVLEYVHKNNVFYAEDERRYVTYRYRNEHYALCRDCGQWFKKDEMVKVGEETDWGWPNYYYYCKDCHENKEVC